MNAIKYYRKIQQIPVKKLSTLSGIAVGYLSNLENEKASNPSKTVMERIASALGKTVPEIFYKDIEDSTKKTASRK